MSLVHLTKDSVPEYLRNNDTFGKESSETEKKRGGQMIGELIGLAFVIGFILFCIAGVGLILMDKERDDK